MSKTWSPSGVRLPQPHVLGPGQLAWLLVIGVPLASVLVLSVSSLHRPAVVDWLFVLQLVGVGMGVLAASRAVTGTWFGLLITGLNRYSLSRAQMLAWTLLLVVGLLTAAEINLLQVYGACRGSIDEVCGVLEISIPSELLVAAGISMFSAVAAPALLSLKSNNDADPDQQHAAAVKMFNLTGQATDTITTVGQVVANKHSASAHWSDLISGEEVGNAGSIDLSKVQQVLVTLLLIGVYAGALAQLFAGRQWISSMPAFNATLVELMAVSHAGYLAYKAMPKPGQGGAGQATEGAPAVSATSPAPSPGGLPPLPMPADVAGPRPS